MKLSIAEAIKKTENPGSGILVGKSEDGTSLLTAYFVCCSSMDSLHRRFVEEGGGVVIEPTTADNKNPDYIYQPVLTFENKVLMGNGLHVEKIYNALCEGKSFSEAEESDELRDYPRLTALVDIVDGDFSVDMRLGKPLTPNSIASVRESFRLRDLKPGTALLLTMYGGAAGEPYAGEPMALEIEGSIFDVVAELWENMNSLNRVSLWVRETEMSSHRAISRIINRNK